MMTSATQAALAHTNVTLIREYARGPFPERREAGSHGQTAKVGFREQLELAPTPRRFRRIAFEACLALIERDERENIPQDIRRLRMNVFLDEIGRLALRLSRIEGGTRLLYEINRLQFRIANSSMALWSRHLKRSFRKAGRTSREIGEANISA